MMSRIGILGRAVADVVGGTFYFVPQFDRLDLTSPKIVVTDAGSEIETTTRGHIAYADTIRIVYLANVDKSGEIDNDAVDGHLRVIDALIEILFANPTVSSWSLIDVSRVGGGEEKAHYYPENLLQEHIFAAAISARYVQQEMI